MYCTKCGKKVNDNDLFCSYCGYEFYRNEITVNKENENKEKVSIGWWFLAFFIPIVGLILFFVKPNPKMKKRLLSGTIIGFITGVISIILVVVIILTSFFNNSYKCVNSEVNDGYEVHQTSILKLFDEKDGIYEGYFVLSSIYTAYYKSDFYSSILDGEAEMKESSSYIGNWAELRNGTIELTIFEMTVKYEFSGEGEEKLKEVYEETFSSVFNQDVVRDLINEKEVTFTFNDNSFQQYVKLNKEDSTFKFTLN